MNSRINQISKISQLKVIIQIRRVNKFKEESGQMCRECKMNLMRSSVTSEKRFTDFGVKFLTIYWP